MIEIHISRKYSSKEVNFLINDFEHKYDHLSDLLSSVRRGGCSDPNKVDDLMIWSTIINSFMEGVEYETEFVDYTPEALKVFSQRRIELLETIIKNRYGSVRELSDAIGRDYKNTYEDLRMLENAGLIELKKYGRERKIIAIPLQITVKIK